MIATIGDATFHDKPPVNGRAVKADDIEQSFKRFREEMGIGYDWLHNVMDDIVGDERPRQSRSRRSGRGRGCSRHRTPARRGPARSCRRRSCTTTSILNSDAIGSAHWVLESHENGANIKFRKFQNFREPGSRRCLDGVDFKLITDDTAALAAFKAGEIDVYGFTNKSEAEDTAAEMGDKIVVGSDLARDYVNLMLKYEPPFDGRARASRDQPADRPRRRDAAARGGQRR